MKNKLSLFEDIKIRKVYKNNKWYYSINDVITFLTDTNNSTQYLNNLKNKDHILNKNWNDICIMLNMNCTDGKVRKIMTTDTIGILRIIQSIQAEKTEPFKQWLARLGEERLEEINDPELLMDKMKMLYEKKGYSTGWIEQREREITTRHSLKEEWEIRGIKTKEEYNILINEIYKSSFNINIDEYSKIKEISKEKHLKDSMTNLELALINLSETSVAYLHKKNNSKNISELKNDINTIGKIIVKTKKEIEEELKQSIISNENNMNLTNRN